MHGPIIGGAKYIMVHQPKALGWPWPILWCLPFPKITIITSGERHRVSTFNVLNWSTYDAWSTIRPAHTPEFDLSNFCAGVGFWGGILRWKVLWYGIKKTSAAVLGDNLRPKSQFFQLELNPGIKSNPDIHFLRTDVVNDGQSNAPRATVAIPYESWI